MIVIEQLFPIPMRKELLPKLLKKQKIESMSAKNKSQYLEILHKVFQFQDSDFESFSNKLSSFIFNNNAQGGKKCQACYLQKETSATTPYYATSPKPIILATASTPHRQSAIAQSSHQAWPFPWLESRAWPLPGNPRRTAWQIAR